MNSNRLRLVAVLAVAMPSAFFAPSAAHAGLINMTVTWSGENIDPPNSVLVVARLAFDTASFAFDAFGPLGHEWWYNTFTTSGVVVSGSTSPTANGTFGQSSFADLVIDSSAATPELAMSSPDLQVTMFASGIDHAPSAYHIGALQVDSGAVSYPGAEKAVMEIVVIPEPATCAVGLLCLGAGLALRRRRA